MTQISATSVRPGDRINLGGRGFDVAQNRSGHAAGERTLVSDDGVRIFLPDDYQLDVQLLQRRFLVGTQVALPKGINAIRVGSSTSTGSWLNIATGELAGETDYGVNELLRQERATIHFEPPAPEPEAAPDQFAGLADGPGPEDHLELDGFDPQPQEASA